MEIDSSTQDKKGIDDNIKIILVTIAVVFLNIGLSFILTRIAPVIAGVVAGYLIQSRRKAILSSFIGTFVAYLVLFSMIAEELLEILIETAASVGIPESDIIGSFWLVLVMACLLISILGIIGAFIGHVLRPKDQAGPKYLQSDDLV